MGAEMGPGPDVEHHHHHHTGHRWLDVTLGVSAVFISLMSLLLAIQHGNAMEKMVQVSSWPYVLMDSSNAMPDGTRRVRLLIRNKGVGPAKIESIEVFYDDQAQADAQQLLRAMLKITDPAERIRAGYSDILDTVLSAREEAALLQVFPEFVTPQQLDTLSKEMGRLDYRVCYCSVFDECTIWDSRPAAALRLQPAKACPVPKTMFLH